MLALTMLFSITGVKAFANNSAATSQPIQMDEPIDLSDDIVTISANSDGTFAATSTVSLSANTLQIHAAEEYDEIYMTQDSRYFKEVQEGTFLEVQPVGGAVTEYSTYRTMENLGIPKEVLEDISGMAAFAKAADMDDIEVTMFVPCYESNTSRTNQDGYVQTLPRSATSWNGETFYHYELYYTGPNGIWTGYQTIISRVDDVSKLRAIITLYLKVKTAIGTEVVGSLIPGVGLALSIYGAGQSCWDAWQEYSGVDEDQVIWGSLDDKAQIDVSFNLHRKYTYILHSSGVEKLGCVTDRAFIRQIKTRTFLYTEDGFFDPEQSVTVNESLKTPSYDSPEYTAYDYRNTAYHSRETIIGEVSGMQFNLSPEVPFSWPSDWP